MSVLQIKNTSESDPHCYEVTDKHIYYVTIIIDPFVFVYMW